VIAGHKNLGWNIERRVPAKEFSRFGLIQPCVSGLGFVTAMQNGVYIVWDI